MNSNRLIEEMKVKSLRRRDFSPNNIVSWDQPTSAHRVEENVIYVVASSLSPHCIKYCSTPDSISGDKTNTCDRDSFATDRPTRGRNFPSSNRLSSSSDYMSADKIAALPLENISQLQYYTISPHEDLEACKLNFHMSADSRHGNPIHATTAAARQSHCESRRKVHDADGLDLEFILSANRHNEVRIVGDDNNQSLVNGKILTCQEVTLSSDSEPPSLKGGSHGFEQNFPENASNGREQCDLNQIHCVQYREASTDNQTSQQKIDTNFLQSCSCRACGLSFTDVFRLNFHIYKVHEKSVLPTCLKCSATFSTTSSLFHHLKKHKRLLSRPTESHQCKLNALVQETASQIVFNQTANQTFLPQDSVIPSIFHCGECGNGYRHKKSLMTHIRLKHLGYPSKTHRCELCCKSFSSRWQLRNHVSWRHLGHKPYVCLFCNQGFVCLPTLKRHQRSVHTGERPYLCFLCGEGFIEKAPYDLHKAQMHTGIFPFVCSQCGRGFVQRSYLRNHMKVHSLLRPFKCQDCGKQYSRMSHLKRHKISCAKKAIGKKNCSKLKSLSAALDRV